MNTIEIPIRKSLIIGQFFIKIRDILPYEIRNSREWEQILDLASSTVRKNERRRLDIILDWMWTDVLIQFQSVANEKGFGNQWKTFVDSRDLDTICDLDKLRYITDNISFATSIVSQINFLGNVRLTKNRAKPVMDAILNVAFYVAAYGKEIGDHDDEEYQKNWLSFDIAGLLNRLIEA
ncbi:hypothetical protein EBT16_01015 [bacterium]|nr:hypothetical protein [bacterium]